MKNLAELQIGENGKIYEVIGTDEERHRFWPFGLFPGEVVKLIRRAPYFKDPLIIEIRGGQLVIGLDEAKKIIVEQQ